MTKPTGYEWGPWLQRSLWRSVDISGLTIQISGDGEQYRVQIPDTSEQLTKPYVDPDWLADWVQWISRDEDGEVFAFDSEPQNKGNVWGSTRKFFRFQAIKHEAGTCDWKDSLVSREELEAEKLRRDACVSENDFAMWGGR